jgi:arginine/lysine/ornithine decarboxylase
MAEAVGAEQAFFSTCGSSLSVKAAMLAVAGGQGELLISRDTHKSVVAGLVFSGVQPQWIRPRYDTQAASGASAVTPALGAIPGGRALPLWCQGTRASAW